VIKVRLGQQAHKAVWTVKNRLEVHKVRIRPWTHRQGLMKDGATEETQSLQMKSLWDQAQTQVKSLACPHVRGKQSPTLEEEKVGLERRHSQLVEELTYVQVPTQVGLTLEEERAPGLEAERKHNTL
jgi:hypothetical protein